MNRDPSELALALIDAEERKLKREILDLLARTKRECKPDFADRMETYLRKHGLVDRNEASN